MSKTVDKTKPRDSICKKCGKEYLYDGGAGKNRVDYCIQCTEQLRRETGEENKECICVVCSAKYRYHRRKKSSTKKCGKCMTQSTRVKKKAKLIAYLGGKCKRCGYDRCQYALEFHHRNADTKAFNITERLDRPFEQLQKEADKCEILCANCHREEEYGINTKLHSSLTP